MKIIFSMMMVAMLFGCGAIVYLNNRECNALHNGYTFRSQDVSYLNSETGLQLAGTLTIPNIKKPAPAIILVAGTGRHERDCTSAGKKLFVAIADYLAARGIAVLRYDKRGIGKSQGMFDLTLTSKDFASDAKAGIEYLKTRTEIDHQKIGMLGHSEGGLIVCMIASESDDVKFVISMAGAASTTIENIVGQAALQVQAEGVSQEIINLDRGIRTEILDQVVKIQDKQAAAQAIDQLVQAYFDRLTPEQNHQLEALAFESGLKDFEPQAPVYAISKLNSQFMKRIYNSDWVRFLISYDASAALRKIKVPVLAVNGSNDFIVAAQVALPLIAQGLAQGNNQDYQVVAMPHLNHWFETCATGSLTEYGKTTEVIAPAFLKLIGSWLCDRIIS